jgi:hypothetical protein
MRKLNSKKSNTKSDDEKVKEVEAHLDGKITFYDPPSGWKYGFPKQYSPLPGESLAHTLKRDGYPEIDCEFAEKHTRFWDEYIKS